MTGIDSRGGESAGVRQGQSFQGRVSHNTTLGQDNRPTNPRVPSSFLFVELLFYSLCPSPQSSHNVAPHLNADDGLRSGSLQCNGKNMGVAGTHNLLRGCLFLMIHYCVQMWYENVYIDKHKSVIFFSEWIQLLSHSQVGQIFAYFLRSYRWNSKENNFPNYSY